ncbi:MAG: hypothetical protein V3T17_12385 [Pseudomonadales bacterium]
MLDQILRLIKAGWKVIKELGYSGYRKERNTKTILKVDYSNEYRIPLIKLFAEAEKDDFKFKDTDYPVLKFANALRQAGLDGKLTFWGRPKRYKTDESIKREPLNEIPKEHWKDFEIDWIAAFDIKPPTDAPQHIGKENFYLGTHTFRADKENEIAYMDLNVNATQSRLWMHKKL